MGLLDIAARLQAGACASPMTLVEAREGWSFTFDPAAAAGGLM
jgi:hypothetical protein